MFILVILALSATGQLSMKTIPFNSQKKCDVAALKLNQKNSADLKITALCLDKGIGPRD